MKIQKATLRVLIISLVTAVSATIAWSQNATLYNWVLVNNTRADIVAVYLVRSGVSNWGKDVLDKRDGSLDSGEKFTLHVSVGEYDIKLVKQNEDICVVKHTRVTGPLRWNITNQWLADCVNRSDR